MFIFLNYEDGSVIYEVDNENANNLHDLVKTKVVGRDDSHGICNSVEMHEEISVLDEKELVQLINFKQ